MPLGLAVVLSVARFGAGAPGAAALAFAALAAGVATLAYGRRTVQRVAGRSRRPWMAGAVVGSVLPPAVGLWLLGWEGLRALAQGPSGAGWVTATLHVGLGVWVLRTWMKVLEIERLAQIMLLNPPDPGGRP